MHEWQQIKHILFNDLPAVSFLDMLNNSDLSQILNSNDCDLGIRKFSSLNATRFLSPERKPDLSYRYTKSLNYQ